VTDRLTDRPTDHATSSVAIDRIYVRRTYGTAMRPNNIMTANISRRSFTEETLPYSCRMSFMNISSSVKLHL